MPQRDLSQDLLKPGLISDAIWTDMNGDQWPDLILAGEWMPITVFENEGGQGFKNITEAAGLANHRGWWNSLAAADLDQDGDMDYIAGNFGENLYFRCSSEEPIRIYGKDLDDNGMIDPLISCYWQDSLGNRDEFLYHPRQDLVKQFVGIRKKFNTYGEYGEASVSDMFTAEELEGALILSANWMKSVVLENLGNGQFAPKALPVEVQLAPIYGILPYDIDLDGQLDLLLLGNDHGMELQQGRADAFNGLALLNKGGFDFKPLSIAESNFMVRGDAKGIVNVIAGDNKELVVATQNKDSLMVFQAGRQAKQFIPLKAGESKAVYHYSNGAKRLEEFYWGSGFMSQKGRYAVKVDGISKVELMTSKGEVSRVIQ